MHGKATKDRPEGVVETRAMRREGFLAELKDTTFLTIPNHPTKSCRPYFCLAALLHAEF
jgi:hypothetical protein